MVRRAVFFECILSLALLAGCGHKTSHAPVAQATGTEAGPEHDVCSLLDGKEVEVVLGAPLIAPPFHLQEGTPRRGGASCGYEDVNFHGIVVEVSWSGGAEVWKMWGSVQSMVDQAPASKGMLHLADGSDIAGEWDEARVLTCCTFMALRGDQTVSVDVGSTPTVTIQQAAKLADVALKRLDKPLPIDGDKGVQPAIDYRAAHGPKPVDPCSLLSRADAESVMGPLAGDPHSQGDTCTYPRGNRVAVELKVRWTGGFRELRETSAMTPSLAAGLLRGLPSSPDEKQAGQKTPAGSAPEANPAWEASGPTGPFSNSAVRHDVMVTIDSMGLSPDQRLAVLAKAMSKF